MKKKLILMLVTCCTLFLFTGCVEETVLSVNVENSNELNSNKFGEDALIEIGNKLYYDSSTRIIYWWNGYFSANDSSTAPSPYYAPNGLPYKYNPETNTFEEIETSKQR